jgi:diguanylate cyclase (GGDEF)-like protein
VAAAVLIALGVSDHVRQQSLALTDAERRAQTDPLTGVLNRRSLIERLDAACLRARARNLPISVLFLDLDHFKLINDTFSHAAGDACLAGIIPPIQAELRQSDVIGRYGGEEFVVILYGADAVAAHPIAERICRRVAEIRIEGFGADPAHLQHRGGGSDRSGLGPAPDCARRHRPVRGQALGAQPGAARRLARGLNHADPRRRAERRPAPAVAGAPLLGVREHRRL